MTSPSTEAMGTPDSEKPASLWEDFIDIFYAPTSVFRRRANGNPWPAIIVICVLILIVVFATYNPMAGAIESDIRRSMAKNPQMTQDMIDRAVKFGSWSIRLAGLLLPLIFLFAALFVWLFGKIVGSKASYQTALVIVTYASIIDVAKAIVTGAVAMVSNPERLTSMNTLSIGPAHFVDPTTASPLLVAILGRFDLFTLWYTVLLGIGMYAAGKVSKGSAAVFAFLYWALITAFVLVGALRAAAAAG